MRVSVVKLFLFVDLLGVAMVVSILPSLALSRGMSQTFAGFCGFVYGALQMLSAPVVTSRASSFDPRMMLAASSLLTAVSYLMLGLTSSPVLFLVSRCLAGLSRHSSSLSKTFLENDAHLGDLQLLSSIAFIAVPLVSPQLPQRLACVLSVIMLCSAAAIALFFPQGKAKPAEEVTLREKSGAQSARDESLPRAELLRCGTSAFGASLFSSALYASQDARFAGQLRALASASNVRNGKKERKKEG